MYRDIEESIDSDKDSIRACLAESNRLHLISNAGNASGAKSKDDGLFSRIAEQINFKDSLSARLGSKATKVLQPKVT